MPRFGGGRRETTILYNQLSRRRAVSDPIIRWMTSLRPTKTTWLTRNDEYGAKKWQRRLEPATLKNHLAALRRAATAMTSQGLMPLASMTSLRSLLTPDKVACEGLLRYGCLRAIGRSIAGEYRSCGIRCNATCPGFIRTEHDLNELVVDLTRSESVRLAALRRQVH